MTEFNAAKIARTSTGARVDLVLVSEMVTRGAKVLDVGCGDGSVALQIKALRPDVEISGIDILVRPAAKISVTAFDGHHIPFDDGSFDAVMLVDVLHHAEDARGLLAEAARVARTAVVIKDHLADGFLAQPTLRAMDWVGNAGHGVVLPYSYWREEQWTEAFAATHLTPIRTVTSLGLYPWPFSAVFDRRLHAVWRLDVAPAA